MRLLYEPLTDIPVGFQEVEYLESTGTQYIDLGFVVDSNKKVELGFSATSNQETKVPVGVYDGTNWTYIVYTFGANGLVTFNNSTVNTLGTFNTNKHDVSVDYKNLTYTYDGVSNTLSGTPRDYTLNLILFGRNNNGTPDAFFNGLKVYYLRAYDNGVLIRDMVPCLDKNNIPCLWDKVEGKAYYNKGTGTFGYGREIHYVDYLESTGTQYINTGYTGNSTTRVIIGASSSLDSSNIPLFGARDTTGYYNSFSIWQNVGTNGMRFDYTDTTPNTVSSKTWLTTGVNIIEKNGRYNYVNGVQVNSNANKTFNCNNSFYLMAIDTSDVAVTGFVGSVSFCEIYENNTLVRDFIPAIDENSVGFMFDKVTHKIYDNAGTGSFVVGKVKKKKKLRIIHDSNRRVPKGFKEVEYIQSSGTQYINTGFIPTGNTGIDIRFLITGWGSGSDSNIIMSGGDSANYRCGFGYRSSSATSYGHTLQISGICASGVSWENVGMTANVPHNVSYNYDNQKKCYLDGVLKRENIPYGTATVTYPMFIFTSNMNGSPWRSGAFKLYYCKIVDNGVLVRDFIPCLDSNNVPCLWDTVTKQAYYNQGTGDFTYGSIIKPVKYLESSETQYIDAGVTANVNTKIDVMFSKKNTPVNYINGVVGSRGSSASTNNVMVGLANAQIALDFNNSSYATYRYIATNTLEDVIYRALINKESRTLYQGSTLVGQNTNICNDTISTGNIWLFKARDYGSVIAKIYYCKIWDNNVLVRDFMPVKDENGVGYMLDTVTHTLYGNLGTGSFVVGQELNNKVRFIDDEIPSAYQRVNWLKSSGAQYIDTGVDGKSGLKAKIGFEWGTEDIGQDRYVLAAADGYYGRCYFGTFQSKWMYGYSSYWQSGTPEANKYYDAEISWELNNQYLKIDGETLITQTIASALDVRNTMFMFARNQGGPNWYSYAKIYYCQMWENGVMVRNYVPVVRKSDNKPGMYDRITKQFYVNDRAGVADFTYG